MTTYLCYARTGKEFEVESALRECVNDVWCGRVIEWKRVGKKRRPEPIEKPALPNYLFATMTDGQFHEAQGIKYLAATMAPLGRHAERGFHRFRHAVDAEYAEADRARRNSEVPSSEFRVGELLEIIGGPFSERIATFRQVVERAHELHPRLRLDVDGVPVEIDPLDVRRATA